MAQAQKERQAGLQRSAEIVDQYWKSQGQQDRSLKDFSDYIRGNQTYTGPGGVNYTLPAGQTYWQDAQGNIIGSNDPNSVVLRKYPICTA
jgi:hypothetical protein